MWAMNKLRHYLLGKHFFTRFDHRPLVGMYEGKMNHIIENWIWTIMRFQFTGIYLPGTDNWFADALSRQHDDQDVMVGGKDDNVSIRIISLDTEETLAMAAEKKGKKPK